METSEIPLREHKYVFVCGLQRSGTSVLARNIGRLEGCTSFKNTGVLQDEGQYLQSIYPPDAAYGGTGRYGFDPRAHLTEESPLLTPENIAALRASWHQHWDNTKNIFLEKTPGNLIMTRFLQAVFPNSYFIVVRRHPVPVSMATKRWKISMTSLHSLFEHWLRCHDLFEADRAYLGHVYELSYEDYVLDSARYHREIAAFLGTKIPEQGMEDVTDAHNRKYLQRWSELLTKSPFRGYYQYIAELYDPRFARYGYSLLKSFDGTGFKIGHVPSAAVGEVYRVAADFGMLLGRSSLRAQWEVKKQLRARLPAPLKKKIKEYVNLSPADARNTRAS